MIFRFILTAILIYPSTFELYAQSDNLEQLSLQELDSMVEKLYVQGNFKKAISFAIFGKNKAFATHGKDTTYATFVSNLAELYRVMGKYEIAESLFFEALEIREKTFGKNHTKYATILNNLAVLFKNKRQYDMAEQYYLHVLAIFKVFLGKNHPHYAETLNNLAVLYELIGENTKAESFFHEVLAIYKKTIGINHYKYAIILNNLALLYDHMGQYKKAESMYLKALSIYKKTLGKNHHSYALTLNNLALLYHNNSHYKEAEPLYLEALKVKAKTLGTNHRKYATSLNNLAMLYHKIHQYNKANHLYKETLLIVSKTLGKNHPYYAQSLNNLAQLHADWGNQKQAWHYINLAFNSLTSEKISLNFDSKWLKNLKQHHYASVEHMVYMVKLLKFTSDLLERVFQINKNKQLIVAELAIHLLKRIRKQYIFDQDKLHLLELSHIWMLKILQLVDLDKEFDLAFSMAEFHKSILLLEATKATKAYKIASLPDSIASKERLLQGDYSEIRATLLKTKPSREKDSLRKLLNKVYFKLSAFQKEMMLKYPNYAHFKYQGNGVSVKELQQNLKSDETILEYVLGDSSVYVFYLDKYRTNAIKLSIGIDSLNDYANQLHKEIINYSQINKEKQYTAYQTYTNSAFWCYEKLVMPILANKKEIQHLIIIPDGILCHLPFEAFLTEKAPPIGGYQKLDYLIEKYQVSYDYSAALWKENQQYKTRSNNSKILAMAGNYTVLDSVAMKHRLPAHRRLRSKLIPLPAAQQEVRTLSQKFQGQFKFDSTATEAMFKKEAGKYGIIHLAMHGVLDEQFPTLSSLVFSENQDSLENNILQAYEIAKLQLNADLVVLSACQTGYGKFERGNGIASLARAFMYGGTPALVVSLWQVDDLATSKIMKEFYMNLAAGLNKPEAIRQAKLTYIKNASDLFAHPGYWSAFIQIGDRSPTIIHKKKNWQIIWLLVILGVIVVTFITIKLKIL